MDFVRRLPNIEEVFEFEVVLMYIGHGALTKIQQVGWQEWYQFHIPLHLTPRHVRTRRDSNEGSNYSRSVSARRTEHIEAERGVPQVDKVRGPRYAQRLQVQPP
ncbi:hypothetical protein DFH09DRAFT_1080827 [Mycena vulgaris]|nr:hypothetical protein DFH09DRAFT_1080827 [Mycena vulgaris]